MSAFATLWTAACQASLSFTIYRSLLKFLSIELVMPSNHLILWPPSPLALSSQHQDLFQWFGSSHQVARVLELQHQSFQWIFMGILGIVFKTCVAKSVVWKIALFSRVIFWSQRFDLGGSVVCGGWHRIYLLLIWESGIIKTRCRETRWPVEWWRGLALLFAERFLWSYTLILRWIVQCCFLLTLLSSPSGRW